MATRERGLYKNGNRWWIRVRASGGRVVPRSTGTRDLAHANRIARTLRTLAQRPGLAHWLASAADGEVSLIELDLQFRSGSLFRLREAQRHKSVDLSPLVDLWIKHILPGRHDKLSHDYARQIRALIPDEVPFPATRLTSAHVQRTLESLGTGPTTKRVYFNCWRRFYVWVRRRANLESDPFEDLVPPRRSPPRSVYWEYEIVRQVLAHVTCGERRNALTLVFGSGIELTALMALRVGQVHSGLSRSITVHGTKTESRMHRTVFVDAWAWSSVEAAIAGKTPTDPLFSEVALGPSGRTLRESLYAAQVAAGLVLEPPISPRTGKAMWGSVVGLHNIHDARHTYAINRLAGLDGEPAQSLRFAAYNLGHADEQMVMRVYAKARVEDRLRLVRLSREIVGGPIQVPPPSSDSTAPAEQRAVTTT